MASESQTNAASSTAIDSAEVIDQLTQERDLLIEMVTAEREKSAQLTREKYSLIDQLYAARIERNAMMEQIISAREERRQLEIAALKSQLKEQFVSRLNAEAKSKAGNGKS